MTAASTDNLLTGLFRYDSSVANGIAGVVREQKITDLILGLHHKSSLADSFLGSLSEELLAACNVTTFIYKPAQPLATIKRTIAVVPQNAESEDGFLLWIGPAFEHGGQYRFETAFLRFTTDARLSEGASWSAFSQCGVQDIPGTWTILGSPKRYEATTISLL